MSACGLCGHTPACGSAEIDGTRYCHGDCPHEDDTGVSCYERSGFGLADPHPVPPHPLVPPPQGDPMTDTSTYTDLEETPVSADDDLEALQRAATSLGIDPTEPGAEEWLRGTPDYRLVRFGIASRRMGEAIMDTFRPLIDALAALAAKDEETR